MDRVNVGWMRLISFKSMLVLLWHRMLQLLLLLLLPLLLLMLIMTCPDHSASRIAGARSTHCELVIVIMGGC